MLQPLTINNYTLKYSFDAINKFKSLPFEIFQEGYHFALFDIESLFTIALLNKTINISLDRIYRQKLPKANLNKRKKQNLIFLSSLVPVLANVILT